MKTIGILLLMAVSLNAQDPQKMVEVMADKMASNIYGSFLLGEPEIEKGLYIAKISCPKHTAFENVSYAWKVGIENEYGDIEVLKYWSRDEDYYSIWLHITEMDNSNFMIMYIPRDQVVLVGHGYKD